LVILKVLRGVSFTHIWIRRAVNVRTEKQDSDHAEPRLWKLLNAEKPFDLSDYASFLFDFAERGSSWRFAAIYSSPRDRPLSLRRMAGTLANEKDAICSLNYGTNANYSCSHE